jgi:hypothetical protein
MVEALEAEVLREIHLHISRWPRLALPLHRNPHGIGAPDRATTALAAAELQPAYLCMDYGSELANTPEAAEVCRLQCRFGLMWPWNRATRMLLLLLLFSRLPSP